MALREQLLFLQEENTELSRRLGENQVEIQKLRQQVANAEDSLQDTKHELAALQNELDGARSSNQSLKDKLHRQHQEKKELAEKFEKTLVELQNQRNTSSFETVNSNHIEDATVQHLDSTQDGTITALAVANERIFNLESELETLGIQHREYQARANKLLSQSQTRDHDQDEEELHHLREEIMELRAQVSKLESINDSLKSQMKSDAKEADNQFQYLETLLMQEKVAQQELQDRISSLSKELQTNQSKLIDVEYQLEERDEELLLLRKKNRESWQFMPPPTSSPPHQLDFNHIHESSTTKQLLEKQQQVENLRAQLSALQLEQKSEREQNELKMTRLLASQQNTPRKKWKTYPFANDEGGAIDSFLVKLLAALRNHQLSRYMFFAYLVLIHVWAFIILVTYQPEAHHHLQNIPVVVDPHNST